ncbi:hypothetical protein DV738_g454, partial [Chaetothyriales sp. CBS 135597]
MRLSSVISVVLGATAAAAGAIQKRELTAVTVKGNAFFAGNNRFYIRGVDYQPGGSSKLADPIADEDGCKRDIVQFKKLGINAIRVYTVDNTADHDACMEALADAGIYLILDVNTPFYSLNRANPSPSYNAVYLQNIFATIDAFAGYTNTLAFFSGNEVINAANNSDLAPYVKAVTRDMRNYISARNYRTIPVGYSAADVSENRLEMAEYMNCGPDEVRSDFFAFNDYSWCNPSSFTQSGWDQKVKNFTGYGIPLFLSEYGCNTNTRTFEEVASLYSTEMTAVYSGGLVYEYSQEANKYGLVSINGDSVTELDDFTALQSEFSKTDNPSGNGGYNSTGGASGCPAASANWDVTTDDLPAFPDDAKQYLTKGAGTGPGLDGAGSQNAGPASTTTTSTSSSGSASATSSGAAGRIELGELSFVPVAFAGMLSMLALFGASLL